MPDETLKQEIAGQIPAGSITRDSSSYVDPNGYVFHHDGEIYRYLHPEAAPRYEALLKGDGYERLLSHGLVPTEWTDLRLSGDASGRILHHRRIAPMTYCVEWCPSMLRDAGRMTLELALEANEQDLMLQDAYPWNVVFDGSRPVFVDFTSLVPPDKEVLWPAHDQFEAFFIRPLALATDHKSDVARALLLNNIDGVSIEAFHRLTSLGYHLRHPGLGLAFRLNRRIQKSAKMKDRVRRMAAGMADRLNPALRRRFLQRLLSRVEGFRFKTIGDPWARYYEEIEPGVEKDEKTGAIRRILTDLAPDTVLDLGCNTGVFSIIAAECGARVISVDGSEPCIETLYATAVERELPITPIVSNVLCPTPPFGYMGRQYPGLCDRAESDVVLCLGLMHHLHLAGRQSWDRILDLLSTLARRCLVFEFVGLDDDNIALLPQRRDIEYDLDSVTAVLRREFTSVETITSDRESRRLLLCRR